MTRLGGLLLIVRRSLRQHAFSTVVTALSVALASGLLLAVFSIEAQARRTFTGGAPGIDAVLGARGSQLQLVLNAVFHLETSPGNLPWSMYRAAADHPSVEWALPYAVGDNFQGFRLVGTTDDIFERFRTERGEGLEFARGGPFDARRQEAVVGSFAARRSQLGVGSIFRPYHGLAFDPEKEHEEEYVVVGVLEPTNTPLDRVILIPLEGIFRMGGHVLRGTGEVYAAEGGKEIPDEHKEVSAVLLRFREGNLTAGFELSQTINRQGNVATLAWPIGQVMADLFDRLGWVNRILELVAYLVLVVAAGSITSTIYNTIRERRREFAILRSLGARRRTVFGVVVLESLVIAALGLLIGLAVYAGIFALAAWLVRERTGVVLEVFMWHPIFLWGPLGVLALGALAGLVPAREAYRLDVAENLAPTT